MNLYENNKVNNEIDAYLLGFFYADGFITGRNKKNGKYYVFGITLSSKDKDFLNEIAKILETKTKDAFSKRYDKSYPTSRLSIGNIKFVETLISLGIKPQKTLENDDKIFDNIPPHLLNHFVRGFFDGDGSIYKKNGSRKYIEYGIGFVGLNEKFLHKLQSILSDNCEIHKKKIRLEKQKYARLNYGGNVILTKIKDFLYKDSTFFLKRKRDLFNKVEIKSKLACNGYRGLRWSNDKKKWIANYKRTYLAACFNKKNAIRIIKNYEKIHGKQKNNTLY